MTDFRNRQCKYMAIGGEIKSYKVTCHSCHLAVL